MAAIAGTELFQILFLALAMSTAACSAASNGGNNTKVANNNASGVKAAYILEKTNTPTKWDPAGSVVVKFKHCVQGQPGKR